MIISRNWLQTYFETELPNAEELAQVLLLHAFEIEGVEHKDGDDLIDIDVLPNRAHDCLCHEGVARELSGLLKLPIKIERYKEKNDLGSEVSITIENQNQCRRYAAFRIEGVEVKPSAQWLQDRLTSLGQKSINNVVDATNYVMFDIGQPLHAFDADKVVGGITIRNAQEGEIMIALTGEELELTHDDLVIADDEGVLALAGVKGGTKAEVTKETKNIIVEIANFHPTTTRITSRRVKIQTDSSKRFENEITPELVAYAAGAVEQVLLDVAGGKSSVLSDVYPYPVNESQVSVTLDQISRVLGLSMDEEQVRELFNRFQYQFVYGDGVFNVVIPKRRLDLAIPEDLIEEIGRWYGYHNIPSVSVTELASEPQLDKQTYLVNKIKNILINAGYSELMTYGFVKKGDISLLNPIASDKQSLRTTIHKQLTSAVEMNAKNASYFGDNRVRVFEIGRVYKEGGEDTRCAIGCMNIDKKARKMYGEESQQLAEIKDTIFNGLGFDVVFEEHENILSFSVSNLLENVSLDLSYGDVFTGKSYSEEAQFQSISLYPYSNRDISLWVNESTTPHEVKHLIEEHGGPYLKKIFLFDEFTKEERTSYAFSLIFQAHDKTLNEEDIDGAMGTISEATRNKGWEIR